MERKKGGDVDGRLRQRNDVVIKAGGTSFAVPGERVIHIAYFGTVSPIPFPLDGVDGLVAFEGRPLCLVDLAQAATGQRGNGALMVVVECGAGPVGLRIDSILYQNGGDETPPLPESLLPRLRGQRDGEALSQPVKRIARNITLLGVTMAGCRVAVPAERLDGVTPVDAVVSPPPRAKDRPEDGVLIRLGDEIITVKVMGQGVPAWVLRLSRDGIHSGLGVDDIDNLFQVSSESIRSVTATDGRASSWFINESGDHIPIVDPLHLLWPDYCPEQLPRGLPKQTDSSQTAAYYSGVNGLCLACESIRVVVPLAAIRTVFGRREGAEQETAEDGPVIDMSVLLGLRRHPKPGREIAVTLPGRGEVVVSADDVRAMTTEKPLNWQPIPPMPLPAADVFDGIAAAEGETEWIYRLRCRSGVQTGNAQTVSRGPAMLQHGRNMEEGNRT